MKAMPDEVTLKEWGEYPHLLGLHEDRGSSCALASVLLCCLTGVLGPVPKLPQGLLLSPGSGVASRFCLGPLILCLVSQGR